MSGRVLVLVGGGLALVGLVAAAVVMQPRPRSFREVAYLALPIAGAVTLTVWSWLRL